jgi:hypothetical protein
MQHIAPVTGQRKQKGYYYSIFNRKLQKWVTIRWPRKRPSVSAVTAAQNKTFAQAMSLVKKTTGEDRVGAMALVKGSPFLPQDALMAAAYGTLLQYVNTGIYTYQGARVTQATIQQLLDSISSIPGSLLVRGDDQWVALLPGESNQVLTVDPATLQPQWIDAQGGGGGGSWTQVGEYAHSITGDVAYFDSDDLTGKNELYVNFTGVSGSSARVVLLVSIDGMNFLNTLGDYQYTTTDGIVGDLQALLGNLDTSGDPGSAVFEIPILNGLALGARQVICPIIPSVQNIVGSLQPILKVRALASDGSGNPSGVISAGNISFFAR